MAEPKQIGAERIPLRYAADEIVQLMTDAGKHRAFRAQDRLDDFLRGLLEGERGVARKTTQIRFGVREISRREIEERNRLRAHSEAILRRRFA
jgi:hypothetical protein